MSYSRKILGAKGERIAREHLKKNFYHILAENYRTKFGELDIVAKEGEVLVFVEVKTRIGREYGLPQEAVDFRKQNKIIRAALKYIEDHHLSGTWRVDVIAIELDWQGKMQYFEHIRNAVMR